MRMGAIVSLFLFTFLVGVQMLELWQPYASVSQTYAYLEYTPTYPTPPLPSLQELPEEYLYMIGIVIVAYIILSSIVKRGEKKRKGRD